MVLSSFHIVLFPFFQWRFSSEELKLRHVNSTNIIREKKKKLSPLELQVASCPLLHPQTPQRWPFWLG